MLTDFYIPGQFVADISALKITTGEISPIFKIFHANLKLSLIVIGGTCLTVLISTSISISLLSSLLQPFHFTVGFSSVSLLVSFPLRSRPIISFKYFSIFSRRFSGTKFDFTISLPSAWTVSFTDFWRSTLNTIVVISAAGIWVVKMANRLKNSKIWKCQQKIEKKKLKYCFWKSRRSLRIAEMSWKFRSFENFLKIPEFWKFLENSGALKISCKFRSFENFLQIPELWKFRSIENFLKIPELWKFLSKLENLENFSVKIRKLRKIWWNLGISWKFWKVSCKF